MYIAVEGIIGAGKTTLAKELAKESKGLFTSESFEDNPFLADFYDNNTSEILAMELHFLRTRHEQLLRAYEKASALKVNLIADYFIDKSLIFGRLNLPQKNFEAFEKIYNSLHSSVPKPDLLIYIQSDPKVSHHNVVNRARHIENNLKADYLRALHNYYDPYILREYKGKTLLIQQPYLMNSNLTVICDEILQELT